MSTEKPTKRIRAEGLSTAIFAKGEPKFIKGVRTPLQEEDLFLLPDAHKTDTVTKKFDTIWQKELKKEHPSLTKAMIKFNFLTWIGVFIIDTIFNASTLVNPILITYIVCSIFALCKIIENIYLMLQNTSDDN